MTVGTKEIPHKSPYRMVVSIGRLVIFISQHLLWQLPCA